jgi:hypothetical protein
VRFVWMLGREPGGLRPLTEFASGATCCAQPAATTSAASPESRLTQLR